MLAAVRIVQDRTEEAIALYRQALAAEPQNLRTMNNLATLLGEQPGRTKEALEFIDRAIDLAGPQGWLLETKGEILLRDGRVDEALPLIQEAAVVGRARSPRAAAPGPSLSHDGQAGPGPQGP